MSALNTEYNEEMASDLAEVEILCQSVDRGLLEELAHPWETVEKAAARFIASQLPDEIKKLDEKGFSGPSKPLLKLVKPK